MRARPTAIVLRLLLGIALTGAAHAGDEGAAATGVTYRVRVTRLTPHQPAAIEWRYGGEGMGGRPVGGSATREKPAPPGGPGTRPQEESGNAAQEALLDEVAHGPRKADRVVVEGATWNEVYLMPGVWSRENRIDTFGSHRGNLCLTFQAVGKDSNSSVTNVAMEFEFLYAGRLLKGFSVDGAAGNTVGVMVPFHRLGADGAPAPEFAREVGSLLEYVQRKRDALRAVPGLDRPVPRLYAVTTDCAGFGAGGYAVRTSDPATMMGEFEVLRLMGVNGTVNTPKFFGDQRSKKQGLPAQFSRLQQVDGGGYQIPMVKRADGRKPVRKRGDGCPFYPATVSNAVPSARAAVSALLAEASGLGVDQVWARTVDEIGSVFDGAPEGKAHQGGCPYCREAFREFVRADGRTPEDFGTSSWDDIRSTYGYWTRSYWETHDELSEAGRAAQAAFDAKGKDLLDRAGGPGKETADAAVDPLVEEAVSSAAAPADVAAELAAAKKRLEDLEWTGSAGEVPETNRQDRLSPAGRSLLWYYSARFNCESSARCFAPLREAYEAANESKREALSRGESGSPEAQQPWIYSFALRGNTFLLGGHSLDFFSFYRHADNAFVYETSNRDWRVWPWDSYLCDVGRTLTRSMGKQFGIYVKPHRGAPIQRALAAAARGARMIYWYTYGPEWVKGDSFGGNTNLIRQVAQAGRLIAGGEDVTYDADWAVPAEVAVVRPLTSEYLSGSASYENAKWVYTALMHAHIPMDALDEGLLMSEDLSRYKVIVISGSHIRRDAAAKLAKWVENGGTLVTSGWGMAQDEATRPLDILWPVFGVKSRGAMDAWGSVPAYGGTHLGAVQRQREPPAGAAVTGKGPLQGSLAPVVGREVLEPERSEDAMATYADGGVAAVRHRHGKGTAWLIGLYAGVEYAWEAMITTDADPKWFRADKRSWIAGPVLDAGVRPVVDAEGAYTAWEDAAFVEGHMLRNRKTGALAVVLINWADHIGKPVRVFIREAGVVRSARSIAAGQTFAVQERDGRACVELPRIDEGDVLLLD